jgi:single-strand DNA-binding protein
MSLSSVVFSGTIKKDPEKRFTPSNIPVANIILEICYLPKGSKGEEVALASQTVKVNAWRDLAEYCEKSLKAGDKITVLGRAQINAYTTQDGKKRRELEIDAINIVLLNDLMSIQPPINSNKKEEETERNTESFKKTDGAEQSSGFDEVFTSNEEIPF